MLSTCGQTAAITYCLKEGLTPPPPSAKIAISESVLSVCLNKLALSGSDVIIKCYIILCHRYRARARVEHYIVNEYTSTNHIG